MPNAFTISRSHLFSTSDVDLRNEITGHTGSETETSSILRSIDRFGSDTSITGYQVHPSPARATRVVPARVAWTVHALRV